MGVYLTETGFQGKTQNEIIQELEAEYRNAFGSNIDLDPDSGFSQQIGIFSKQLVQPWDALAELYTCFDPNHATGTCLDNIVAINSVTRLPATATFVNNVLMEGTEGTVIAAGKKAKQSFNNIDYSLVTGITITKTIAAKGVIEVSSVVVATDYTVVINSVNYTYTAQGGDSKTDILDEIKDLIDIGTWTGTATVAAEQLILLDLVDNFSFDFIGNLSIEEIWSKGDFVADVTGANTLAASSLTEIVTPVAGWNSVTNPQAGSTGREIETDDELRLRRTQSVFTGNATDEAIRSSIFNDVINVTNVIVKSNRTDIVDSEGRDPHSFEAVIEGATDQDIAEKILEVQGAGIQSYGNTQVNITDSQGVLQPIRFSRPVSVFIFVKVRRNFYNEEIYPSNGDALIKEAIVNWSLITTNIDIGKDVIRQRLAEPVYEVPGIEDIEITLDSSLSLPHSPSYSAVNISINDRQKASFAIDRIVVELLP
jgi:uncharacterized phage protein gp47/JayE